jgi:hypothetical protein
MVGPDPAGMSHTVCVVAITSLTVNVPYGEVAGR